MNKKLIIGILTILLLGWIGLSSYWFSQRIKHNSYSQESRKESANPGEETTTMSKPAFVVSDDESFSISNPNPIYFAVGRSGIHVPDTLTSAFAKLALFLLNNEDKSLNINGLYSKSEPSSERIGRERAESVRDYLVYNHGLDAESITLSAVEKEHVYTENNKTYGPVELFIHSTKTTDTLEEETEEITVTEITNELETNTDFPEEISISNSNNVDPSVLRKVKRKQTMYYPPGNFYVNSTRELDRYFNYLKKYFDQNPEGKIEITGYSDTELGASAAKKEGHEKAIMVKKYLMKEHKINSKNLETSGSTRQAEQNSDMEKAKNRKVTFELIN